MSEFLIKRPSALIPLVMSLAALSMVLVHFAVFGLVYETDEGTAAHVFQLLMVTQVPIVAFFAIKWLPRELGQSLAVLVLQTASAMAAIVAVFLLTGY